MGSPHLLEMRLRRHFPALKSSSNKFFKCTAKYEGLIFGKKSVRNFCIVVPKRSQWISLQKGRYAGNYKLKNFSRLTRNDLETMLGNKVYRWSPACYEDNYAYHEYLVELDEETLLPGYGSYCGIPFDIQSITFLHAFKRLHSFVGWDVERTISISLGGETPLLDVERLFLYYREC